jgi:hypothetical protein
MRDLLQQTTSGASETIPSANGAEYESQGQATKERRPWKTNQIELLALKGRNSS